MVWFGLEVVCDSEKVWWLMCWSSGAGDREGRYVFRQDERFTREVSLFGLRRVVTRLVTSTLEDDRKADGGGTLVGRYYNYRRENHCDTNGGRWEGAAYCWVGADQRARERGAWLRLVGLVELLP